MNPRLVKSGPSRYRVEDAETGAALGVVWNNGARPSYLRHWSYRAPGGEESRTRSRRGAVEALVRQAQR